MEQEIQKLHMWNVWRRRVGPTPHACDLQCSPHKNCTLCSLSLYSAHSTSSCGISKSRRKVTQYFTCYNKNYTARTFKVTHSCANVITVKYGCFLLYLFEVQFILFKYTWQTANQNNLRGRVSQHFMNWNKYQWLKLLKDVVLNI